MTTSTSATMYFNVVSFTITWSPGLTVASQRKLVRSTLGKVLIAFQGIVKKSNQNQIKLNLFNDGTVSNTSIAFALPRGSSEFMPKILLANAFISWFCLKAFLEGFS